MPITKELSNIKKLEAVGFPHEQAEALTDIIEQSHVDGQQSLKEFIHNENTSLELRLKGSQSEMELRLKTSQTDMLIKFSAIVAGFISAALAIAKLLW
jgi:hypothetical protein